MFAKSLTNSAGIIWLGLVSKQLWSMSGQTKPAQEEQTVFNQRQ